MIFFDLKILPAEEINNSNGYYFTSCMVRLC